MNEYLIKKGLSAVETLRREYIQRQIQLTRELNIIDAALTACEIEEHRLKAELERLQPK